MVDPDIASRTGDIGMNSSEVVSQVISEVVDAAIQPDEVKDLLLNWYEEILKGNESIHDTTLAARHAAFEHLELIFDKMWSPHDGDPEEGGENGNA